MFTEYWIVRFADDDGDCRGLENMPQFVATKWLSRLSLGLRIGYA
jgi:hypothetical protein